MELMQLAARHPEASIICGHSGGDWERGLRVIRPFKNVSADLAGSDPCAGFCEMAVRELGPERVIYGSDAGGRSFASQLAKVTDQAGLCALSVRLVSETFDVLSVTIWLFDEEQQRLTPSASTTAIAAMFMSGLPR